MGQWDAYYEAVDGLNPNRPALSAVMLDGKDLGKRYLFSGEDLVYPERVQGAGTADGKMIPEELRTAVPKGAKPGIYSVSGKRFYAETISREKKIVICGAGHVGIAVLKAAAFIGFRTIVIDDRPDFTDTARATGADEVYCDEFAEALKQVEGDLDTYFVIVTRGHRWDELCLREIAGKAHAYIGLMGSRRRVKIVMETLKAEGIPAEVLDRVHTPIGLDIGGETPEEIAVSVIAEIIEVKSREGKNGGFPSEILDAILGSHHNEALQTKKKVLSTIISRKGSAPREAGTKMLTFSDGTCIGTIGGGCVEAEVIQRCRQILAEGQTVSEVMKVDLTAEAAEEEGMVCGGIIEVLLEVL